MKKATNQRKRHVPPGPCGIWFQTQQQLSKNTGGAALSEDRHRNNSTSANTSSHPWPDAHAVGKASPDDMSFSPAWTCMQQELQIITPYLPPTFTPQQRYQQLRPHMPRQNVLLWEIAKGDHDFVVHECLLVLVHSVESHIHHNIWTVELQDETGVTLRAWMEPKFVQDQLQQPQESSPIRPGVVWMLRKVGMIIVPHEPEERLERMLLISGAEIQKVWTPEQAKQQDSSPQSQRRFLDWMEKRKALPSALQEEEDAGSKEDHGPEEEEPQDYEKDPSYQVARAREDHLTEDEDDLEVVCEATDLVSVLVNQRRQQPQGSPLAEQSTRSGTTQEPQPSSHRPLSESQASSRPATQQDPAASSGWSRLRLDRSQDEDTSRPANAWDANNSQTTINEPTIREMAPPKDPFKRKERAGAQTSQDETQPSKRKGRTDTQTSQDETTLASSRSQEIGESHTESTTYTMSQQASSLWNVQDTSILNMLDDDDDDEIQEPKRDALSSKKPASPPSPQATKDEGSQKEDEEITGTQMSKTSMFAASNFQTTNMDFSGFSDDE
jgi:hypothetical protein